VLEFRILGPLEVAADGERVQLGGPRQRATLAILLLHANRVVPVERLAEELYAGRPPVTAVTQVQRQVSELRRALGSASAIQTKPPGYALPVAPRQLDLARFERLTEQALGTAPREAADLLRRALALWRGPPLADLEYEEFSRPAVERLEEMRLAAVEARIDADLALGRHAVVAGELDELAAEHPLGERLQEQRILALYRSGRQVEALDAYDTTRRRLVERFGLEPSEPLKKLQRAILAHDASLELPSPAQAAPTRTLLVVPSRDEAVDSLTALARPLARAAGATIVLARLVRAEGDLESAAATLRRYRGDVRTAAFTSEDTAADVVRLATSNDVGLVLVDAGRLVDGPTVPASLARLLARSPAHVAALAGGAPALGRAVFVPFGGGEHDWAALELAAWLASATQAPLRLVGTRADARTGRRDASRLLADASLAVQRVVDIDATPVLADPDRLVDSVAAAGIVVIGVSPRWPQEGIGETRRALVRDGSAPVVLVHRGPRPGALAPRESRTRFTWTIGDEPLSRRASP
jgi:DNA-binding SARP family transcriptional activator